jgi:hypothetical protein
MVPFGRCWARQPSQAPVRVASGVVPRQDALPHPCASPSQPRTARSTLPGPLGGRVTFGSTVPLVQWPVPCLGPAASVGVASAWRCSRSWPRTWQGRPHRMPSCSPPPAGRPAADDCHPRSHLAASDQELRAGWPAHPRPLPHGRRPVDRGRRQPYEVAARARHSSVSFTLDCHGHRYRSRMRLSAQRPANPSDPPRGCPVATSAAAHRGGPAAAVSAADQRPAGCGAHRFLVGAVHGLLRAGAGIAGPAALAASARVGCRRGARGLPHVWPGSDRPAATPVRG